ncbi:MAG: hypothetical protein ACMUHX_09700 [bacterium]
MKYWTIIMFFFFIIMLPIEGKTQKNNMNNMKKNLVKNNVEIIQSKDILIRVEYLKNQMNLLVGVKVELINSSETNNFVLYIPDNIDTLFYLKLMNTEGLIVSPPIKTEKKSHPREKKYKYISINPISSHSWFLPVPLKIRHPRGVDKKALFPILRGKYELQLKISGLYFITESKFEINDKHPDFNHLNLELSKIEIMIDPDYLGKNVIDGYIEE